MAGLPAPCCATPAPATAAGLGCMVTRPTWSPPTDGGPTWGVGGERKWGVVDLGLLDVEDVETDVEEGGRVGLLADTWGDGLGAVIMRGGGGREGGREREGRREGRGNMGRWRSERGQETWGGGGVRGDRKHGEVEE